MCCFVTWKRGLTVLLALALMLTAGCRQATPPASFVGPSESKSEQPPAVSEPAAPEVPPAVSVPPQDTPDVEEPPANIPTSGTITDDFYPLVLDYYLRTYGGREIYWQEEAPEAPADGDLMLGKVTFLGERRLDEVIGEAYLLEEYWYSASEGNGAWDLGQPSCVVITRGQDGLFQQVVGDSLYEPERESVEDLIWKLAYRLSDVEVVLLRDGYPNPVGIGGSPYGAGLGRLLSQPEVLEGWEPIYQDGDYWCIMEGEDLSAQCYYSTTEERLVLKRLDVTRDDLLTPRGIRVGSTRAEVVEAYPELCQPPYWHYTEGDFLWYCDNPEGWGAAILFFIENDIVTQIRLNDMFN